ncbi:diguanylate cyclase [Desulfoplanes sp. PS50]
MRQKEHLMRLSIRQRIIVLGSMAILGILVSIFLILRSQMESYDRQRDMAEKLQRSHQLLEVIYNLQIERGKTVGYLAEGHQSLFPDILSRMEATDAACTRSLAEGSDTLQALRGFREKILASQVTGSETFFFYTRLIETMIDSLARVRFSGCLRLNQDLRALFSLVNAMEFVAQTRGMVYMALFEEISVRNFVHMSWLRFDAALNEFSRSAALSSLELSGKEIERETYREFFALASSLDQGNLLKKMDDPEMWFHRATQAVDSLKKAVLEAHTLVAQETAETVQANRVRIIFLSVALVILVCTLFYLSLSTLRNILKPFGRLVADIDHVITTNDLAHRISLKTGDELDVIADGFNRLLGTAENLVREKDRLARRDTLTGIGNRLCFDETLSAEVQRARRYQMRLSLIIFDIDHFKRVNDIHGHDVGDEVLKAVAQVVRTSVRRTDILARWGGEEFVVLVPETGLDATLTLAEKLRTAIETHHFPPVGRVTASFGATELCPDDSADALLKRADQGLLQAKEQGRNRIVSIACS